MSEVEPKSLVEFYKAVSGHFRHITTLSSGFVLVMATFLEKLFQNPEWKPSIVVSFVAFALAILSSVIAEAYFIDNIRKPSGLSNANGNGLTTVATLSAWVSFVVGVVSLVVFTIKNLV